MYKMVARENLGEGADGLLKAQVMVSQGEFACCSRGHGVGHGGVHGWIHDRGYGVGPGVSMVGDLVEAMVWTMVCPWLGTL